MPDHIAPFVAGIFEASAGTPGVNELRIQARRAALDPKRARDRRVHFANGRPWLNERAACVESDRLDVFHMRGGLPLRLHLQRLYQKTVTIRCLLNNLR